MWYTQIHETTHFFIVNDRQITFSQLSLRLNAFKILWCKTLVTHFTHY
jgi:hypothetical protein